MPKKVKKNKPKNNRFTWYSDKNLGLFITIKNSNPYKNGPWVFIGIYQIKQKFYYEYEKFIKQHKEKKNNETLF